MFSLYFPKQKNELKELISQLKNEYIQKENAYKKIQSKMDHYRLRCLKLETEVKNLQEKLTITKSIDIIYVFRHNMIYILCMKFVDF